MEQVYVKGANYSVDLFGVCSALYELGGLCVMHDASGCNSTYATHDEPRWYEKDSMIYISGLTEYDAVLGNDEKYIDDVIEIAKERAPKFIAVFGSPVALMMGTDFKGIAHIIENRTGIPSFHFDTNGMNSYIDGAGQAMAAIADRFALEPMRSLSPQLSLNIIGATPLDFSVNGNVESIKEWCRSNGFRVNSCWTMGSSLEELSNAGKVDVNLVVSSSGLPTAKLLKERFDAPVIQGFPMGKLASSELAEYIRMSAEEDGFDRKLWAGGSNNPDAPLVTIIGETFFANMLRFHLENDQKYENVRLVCPLEKDQRQLRDCDIMSMEEDVIAEAINGSAIVIADPLFRGLLTNDEVKFVDFPHTAYSGRMYEKDIPVFASPDFELEI